jgi:hypothetical protein
MMYNSQPLQRRQISLLDNLSGYDVRECIE